MADRTNLIIAGATLLIAGILIEVLAPTSGLFFLLALAGLVTLIVGLVSGDAAPSGPNQQQQQQVVVVQTSQLRNHGTHDAPTKQVRRVRCPQCKHLNPLTGKHCTECGTNLGRPSS